MSDALFIKAENLPNGLTICGTANKSDHCIKTIYIILLLLYIYTLFKITEIERERNMLCININLDGMNLVVFLHYGDSTQIAITLSIQTISSEVDILVRQIQCDDGNRGSLSQFSITLSFQQTLRRTLPFQYNLWLWVNNYLNVLTLCIQHLRVAVSISLANVGTFDLSTAERSSWIVIYTQRVWRGPEQDPSRYPSPYPLKTLIKFHFGLSELQFTINMSIVLYMWYV